MRTARIQVMTVGDVARAAGISARGVRWVIARGELPAVRVGGSWVIARKTGEAWAQRYRAEHDRDALTLP